jgi:hypothetical protein
MCYCAGLLAGGLHVDENAEEHLGHRELCNETGGKNMSGMVTWVKESEQCLVLNVTQVHCILRSPAHPTLIHPSLVSTTSIFIDAINTQMNLSL